MATKRHALATLVAVSALTLSLTGYAEDAAKEPANKVVIGAASGNLLAMQRDGKSAGVAQPVAGEVATRSYHRYLDSFSKPMPEFTETVGSSTKSLNGN